jgi:hypothetical protein
MKLATRAWAQLGAALALGLPGPTHAAKINVVPEERVVECNIEFSGKIQSGDLEVLKAAKTKTNAYPSSLCLDSQAGSYPEGP